MAQHAPWWLGWVRVLGFLVAVILSWVIALGLAYWILMLMARR